jgi:glycerol-3-phosphate dehydrogenase subunit C
MREGSLDAPVRHPIDWNDPDFYDEAKLDEELRRVFDICHGCRRCFNLCDSFPRLFDLIDAAPSEELDTVDSKDFKPVVDACTLCDMCFMVKCPYVPPHEFNLDFPHLMLRYRAVENRKGIRGTGMESQLTKTDRNGKLGSSLAGLANWATKEENGLTRGIMQSVAGVHKDAALPPFAGKTLVDLAKDMPKADPTGPAAGQKAVIYATCYGNYNTPEIGEAALKILAKNGVECEVVYPECCGMPQMEQGDIETVAGKAKAVAGALKPYVEQGYDVIALVPSCALMLKFEWPLITDDPDVKALSEASHDVSEYIVALSKQKGLAEGLGPLDGPIAIHVSCHARAQNMGQKGAELARLIPDTRIAAVERCSGHGGSWGVMKDNFEVGMKVGKPVFKQMQMKGKAKYIASECPLAGLHIAQGIEANPDGDAQEKPELAAHPVVLLAKSYGLM